MHPPARTGAHRDPNNPHPHRRTRRRRRRGRPRPGTPHHLPMRRMRRHPVSADMAIQVATTSDVLSEVQAERARQDVKWGEQNHPDVDQVLMTRPGGCSPRRMAEEYEIPTAPRAKFTTDTAASRGECTWTAIAVEELAEAVEAFALGDTAAGRTELVQLAAVCVQWVQAID